jgi:hypothetical protein
MDFCLRLDMPSGALPVGFADFPDDLDDFEFLLGADLPFGLLPLVEGFVAPIMYPACVCAKRQKSVVDVTVDQGRTFWKIRGPAPAFCCRLSSDVKRQAEGQG